MTDKEVRADSVSLSLRAKYLLLVCAAVISATLLVSAVHFYWIERIIIDKATATLGFETELVATRVKENIEQLRNDALTVSRMPPLKGLIRSARNGGIDPVDGSTDQQWRDRLETIFISVMEARPSNMQMRYIGRHDAGRELVRVDRYADGRILATEPENLQSKEAEPYFQGSLHLTDGQVYFSDITPNIDFGTEDQTSPMLRAVTPIEDDDGTIFGFLVINLHFGELMERILADVPPSPDLYVVTSSSDYVYRSADGVTEPLVLGSRGETLPPPLAVAIEGHDLTELGGETKIVDDRVVSAVWFAPAVENSTNIGVVLSESQDELLAELHGARRMAGILAFGLVLVMAVPAYFVSWVLTRPLLTLATALRRTSPGTAELKLPTERADEIGEVARALSSLITRRRQMEAIQAATLARLQSILDNTVDAMISVDSGGAIQSVNRAATAMFGYVPGELVGRKIHTLIADPLDGGRENWLPDLRRQTREERTAALRELNARAKTGRLFPVELSVSEVQTEGGVIFSLIIREISERRRLEDEIRNHAAALERSNTDLEEFAYIASHDLKEPLRAINNHTQFLAEDHGHKLDEDGLRRIARLRELCARADRLISELLHFSRLGREALKLEQVDLTEIVNQVRNDLTDYLAERHGEIRVVSKLPTVQGDRSRLVSLIQNLVVNGLKYNDEPARLIEIGTEGTGIGEARDRVMVFVRDNGIGIAPEHEDRVFKIFKRLNSEKTYGAGTGVGLSFARKIVDRHGGQLTFTSKPGTGTTFHFDLKGA